MPENGDVQLCKFILTVSAVTLSRFLYGFDRGAIGGASLGLIKNKILTDTQYSVLVSSPIFASVFGGISVGFFQERHGRKLSLIIATLMYILGQALCVGLHSYPVLLVGRILCNFSFGMSHVTSLVYLLEISPPTLRGKVLISNQMVMPFGNSVSGLTNLAISKIGAAYKWRWMMGSCLVPAGLQLILILFIPLSYKWLYSKGRWEDAKKSIIQVYKNVAPDQYREILDIDSSSGSIQSGKTNDISRDVMLRMVIMAIMLMIIPQLGGFSAVMYYSTRVAQVSGFGDNHGTFIISESIFLVNCLGVVISIFLIERLGRRTLLLTSQIGTFCSIALIVAAIYMVDKSPMSHNPWAEIVSGKCLVNTCSQCVVQQGCGYCMFNSTVNSKGFCTDGIVEHSLMDRCENSHGVWSYSHCHSSSNWFIVVAVQLFVIYFSIGLSPIPFLVAAEIFPQHLRDVFTSLSIAIYYTMTAGVTLAFGELYSVLGLDKLFMLFGGFTLLGILFVFRYLPETRDHSTEKMYQLFSAPWCCGTSAGYERLRAPSDDHAISNGTTAPSPIQVKDTGVHD